MTSGAQTSEAPRSRIRLYRGREGRLLRGHPWVYTSQVERVEGRPAPGDSVDVVASSGRHIGSGLVSPSSQIRVRLLTRGEERIDAAFFGARLAAAIAWRRRLFPDERAYRLVFSEGDFLPGLIVDQYEDVLVLQFLTVGMDVRRELIAGLLADLVRPSAMFERSDAPSRALEGLPPRTGWLLGERDGAHHVIHENGLQFEVNLAGGQKTGYFLDQKENRRALQPWVLGARVLDVFCHTGGFAIHAAAFGALEALGVDSSPAAIEAARRNAERNGVAERCTFIEANAFDWLRAARERGERFDCIILDPPAFASSKSAVPGARRGYKEINLRALHLLRPGGILVTCTCSYHMSGEMFAQILLDAAVDTGRTLRLVQRRSQAGDHPILSAVPETEYLKCLICQVV